MLSCRVGLPIISVVFRQMFLHVSILLMNTLVPTKNIPKIDVVSPLTVGLLHNVYMNRTNIGFRFLDEDVPAIVTTIAAIDIADTGYPLSSSSLYMLWLRGWGPRMPLIISL